MKTGIMTLVFWWYMAIIFLAYTMTVDFWPKGFCTLVMGVVWLTTAVGYTLRRIDE